jgi:hypothetical protein
MRGVVEPHEALQPVKIKTTIDKIFCDAERKVQSYGSEKKSYLYLEYTHI